MRPKTVLGGFIHSLIPCSLLLDADDQPIQCQSSLQKGSKCGSRAFRATEYILQWACWTKKWRFDWKTYEPMDILVALIDSERELASHGVAASGCAPSPNRREIGWLSTTKSLHCPRNYTMPSPSLGSCAAHHIAITRAGGKKDDIQDGLEGPMCYDTQNGTCGSGLWRTTFVPP